MQQVLIDFRSLGEIDEGRIKEAFAIEFARCLNDVRNRPGLQKERSVTIKVSLKPRADETGELDLVAVHADCKANIPQRRSKTYLCQDRAGGLIYNEMSPDDPNQMTIPVGPQSTAEAPTPNENEETQNDVG